MKTILTIASLVVLFSCHKAKPNKSTLTIDVTGNEITKTIKGNIYYGSQVIPVEATFEDHYSMEVLVDDERALPSHDLHTAYRNRNVDSGNEHVIIHLSVK